MLRLQLQHVVQGRLPLVEGLAGQAVDEIQGDVVEARLAGLLHGGDGLLVVVGPAQLLEHLVVVVLHAQAHAVEALGVELLQQGRGGRVGVGLEGHLRVGGHVEAALQLVENAHQGVRPEEGGRAAAEIHRIHGILRGPRAELPDVGGQGVHIQVGQLLLAAAAQGIEIAVLAFAAAEGDVDVDAQLLLVRVAFFQLKEFRDGQRLSSSLEAII